MASAKILVVDDEPALLRLLVSYLSRVGHSVESCPDATSALRRFPEDIGKFDVLLADMQLPDGKGDVMAQTIAGQDTKLKVLLCSGLPYDLEAISVDLRDRFATLLKPFSPAMLADAIADLLAKKS